MTLSVPSYIPVDELRSMAVTFEWDFWDPYSILGDIQPQTIRSLSLVSDRAMIAFAIGCSEWVVFRFLDHMKDDRALAYLEACWVFEMSENVYLPRELKENEWQGIVLAPIDLSMLTIINTVYYTEDRQGELKAAFAELIPLHVMSERSLFVRWKQAVLQRLLKAYPRDAEDPWGVPVPREALNPDYPLTDLVSSELTQDFIQKAAGNTYIEYVE